MDVTPSLILGCPAHWAPLCVSCRASSSAMLQGRPSAKLSVASVVPRCDETEHNGRQRSHVKDAGALQQTLGDPRCPKVQDKAANHDLASSTREALDTHQLLRQETPNTYFGRDAVMLTVWLQAIANPCSQSYGGLLSTPARTTNKRLHPPSWKRVLQGWTSFS